MRLALLTGGSRGLGLAIGASLAKRGYTVVEFSRGAPHSFSAGADFASPLVARGTVEAAISAFRPEQLDEVLVISNAATLEPIGPSSGKAPRLVVENLNVNFVFPILFVSAAIARFQSAPCRKVVANISADAAHHGVFGWSLYCAAKVGMEGFIRSLTIEQQSLPHPFVPVNIDPGVVDTDMHAVAASASPSDFPANSRFAKRRAQGRLTPPGQAAAAILTLLLNSALTPGGSYDARTTAA